MSNVPIAGRTQNRSSGFQTLQPGSAATTSLLPTTDMAPDQQGNPTQSEEEDSTSIHNLFPSFDQALATFLHDSFDVPKESHSTLCEALIASQYKTWLDFLYIENIGDLAYLERGTRTPLSRHVQLNLQRVIDFGQHLMQQGLDWEDRNQYTKDAFKDYCRGIFKARRESAADGGTVAHTGAAKQQDRSTKSIEQLKYESWIRKSRDETTFPTLQNDARFDHWLVKFKAKLETSDIDTNTFLDPNWPDIPLTRYTKALHDKQCAFFWTLVLHVFQSDLSSSCVLSHTTTRDGRQAFFVLNQDYFNLHPTKRELLRLHCRLGHADFQWLHSFLQTPHTPKGSKEQGERSGLILHTAAPDTSSCTPLKCKTCQYAKQCCKNPVCPTLSHSDYEEGKLLQDQLFSGDQVSCDQHISTALGCLPHTASKEDKTHQSVGGTMFIDHATDYIFHRHQVNLKITETLRSKHAFESQLDKHGVKVHHYASDNHPFSSKDWITDCEIQNQQQSLSGVGACHQNYIERHIQTIYNWARACLLHSVLHWPH
eukprot:jgi/Psemu1/52316/gm1.52316_g